MESEISDYDEDVILPNSPLGQYMHNFETFDDNFLNEYEKLSEKDNHEKLQKTSSICNTFSRYMYTILDCIKLYLRYIYNIFVPSLIPFEHSDLKLVLEEAKQSKVLISDDLSILLNFESEDEFYGELPLSYVSVFQQFSHLLGYIMIFLILKSTTATNVIKGDYLLEYFPDKLYYIYILLEAFSWIVSKILYLNIFVVAAFIFKNIVELFLCKFLCSSFRKKLHTTEGIIIILKKCIRLVQEAELIARGFTSASIPGIVERLELSTGLPINSPQRQYPELRKCIFIWSKEMFLFYRSATQKLIEKKFGPVLDFSSQSLAMLDLKEFGSLCCDINSGTDFQELLKITDGLSISSLKTMYLLAELQMSEFYKYLYLIASFLVSDDNIFNCTIKISHFWNLNSSVRYLQNEQLCVWKQACEMYKYYRSVELSDLDDKTMTSKKSNKSCLEINVHNMSLHLKAALRRLTDLEELFESSKNSNESNNQKLLQKVEDMTKEIKSEIDAYEEYYQKCSIELQNILYGVKESPVDSLYHEKTAVKSDTVKAAIITCDAEPNIEDEIFEAIATKSSCENEDLYDTFPVEHQKNIEATGKLMHELKNVLIVKADEHRLREEKALARKFNKEGLSLIVNPNLANIDYNTHEAESETSSESEEIMNLPLCSSNISQNDFHSIIEEENVETDVATAFKGGFDVKNSFAASIAALALQRQETLGILDDTCFSDGNYSDDEDRC